MYAVAKTAVVFRGFALLTAFALAGCQSAIPLEEQQAAVAAPTTMAVNGVTLDACNGFLVVADVPWENAQASLPDGYRPSATGHDPNGVLPLTGLAHTLFSTCEGARADGQRHGAFDFAITSLLLSDANGLEGNSTNFYVLEFFMEGAAPLAAIFEEAGFEVTPANLTVGADSATLTSETVRYEAFQTAPLSSIAGSPGNSRYHVASPEPRFWDDKTGPYDGTLHYGLIGATGGAWANFSPAGEGTSYWTGLAGPASFGRLRFGP